MQSSSLVASKTVAHDLKRLETYSARLSLTVFVSIHLLPLLNAKERDKYRKRWHETETFDNQEGVAKAIRDYGNEDVLSRECGDLIESGFLEGETDLKGFQLQGQEFSLHDDWDNFKYIDFKYAEFYNSTFENATFFGASLDCSRLYKCRFVRCGFHFTGDRKH